MTDSPIGKAFAGHALRIGDWAQRAGYLIRHLPLDDRVPPALTEGMVGRVWQSVRDDLLKAYRSGYRIVEAGPCYLVMHDWSGGRGLNSSSFLFSTKGDLYFEDQHWLPMMNGQGPIYQVLDAETGKTFFDLTQPREIIDIAEPHFHLIGNENFGHWVQEIIPRLLAAELFQPEIARLPLVLDKILDPQRDFLAGIGFDNPLKVLHRPGEPVAVYRFQRLFVTSQPPCTLTYPLVQDRVRHAVETAPGSRAPLGNKRYFLSRRRFFPRHRIDNDAEIGACLESFGFETLVSDDFDQIDDMRRMVEAEIVVLPYGAGMGNLPMTGPHCQIILLGPNFLVEDRYDHPVLRFFRHYLIPFFDRLQFVSGTVPPDQPPLATDPAGNIVFNVKTFDYPFAYDIRALTQAVLNAEKALRVRRR